MGSARAAPPCPVGCAHSFNGDSNADILWRNDSGAMAEWLMNGTTIMQSVTPTTGALPISPDNTWTTQAKPTIG